MSSSSNTASSSGSAAFALPDPGLIPCLYDKGRGRAHDAPPSSSLTCRLQSVSSPTDYLADLDDLDKDEILFLPKEFEDYHRPTIESMKSPTNYTDLMKVITLPPDVETMEELDDSSTIKIPISLLTCKVFLHKFTQHEYMLGEVLGKTRAHIKKLKDNIYNREKRVAQLQSRISATQEIRDTSATYLQNNPEASQTTDHLKQKAINAKAHVDKHTTDNANLKKALADHAKIKDLANPFETQRDAIAHLLTLNRHAMAPFDDFFKHLKQEVQANVKATKAAAKSTRTMELSTTRSNPSTWTLPSPDGHRGNTDITDSSDPFQHLPLLQRALLPHVPSTPELKKGWVSFTDLKRDNQLCECPEDQQTNPILLDEYADVNFVVMGFCNQNNQDILDPATPDSITEAELIHILKQQHWGLSTTAGENQFKVNTLGGTDVRYVQLRATDMRLHLWECMQKIVICCDDVYMHIKGVSNRQTDTIVRHGWIQQTNWLKHNNWTPLDFPLRAQKWMETEKKIHCIISGSRFMPNWYDVICRTAQGMDVFCKTAEDYEKLRRGSVRAPFTLGKTSNKADEQDTTVIMGSFKLTLTHCFGNQYPLSEIIAHLQTNEIFNAGFEDTFDFKRQRIIILGFHHQDEVVRACRLIEGQRVPGSHRVLHAMATRPQPSKGQCGKCLRHGHLHSECQVSKCGICHMEPDHPQDQYCAWKAEPRMVPTFQQRSPPALAGKRAMSISQLKADKKRKRAFAQSPHSARIPSNQRTPGAPSQSPLYVWKPSRETSRSGNRAQEWNYAAASTPTKSSRDRQQRLFRDGEGDGDGE